MHQIQEWLNNEKRTYAEGVHLYSLYGKYPSVLKLLQKEETSLTRTKLNEVLRDTWQKIKPDIEERTKAVQEFKTESLAIEKKEEAGDGESELDSVVQGLDAKWKPIYGEMAMVHARLGVCETNEQRYNLALRISELEAQIMAIWEQRDTYLNTGKLPEKKTKITKAKDLPSSAHAELINLRTYVSRMEKQVLPNLITKQEQKPTPVRAKRIEENKKKLDGWKTRIKILENGG
jgi:hypothetical protein